MLAAIGIAMSLPGAAVAKPAQAGSAARERIAVISEGTGPDVVLIPGLASSSTVWSDLVRQLKPKHRLHIVQIAGFAGMPAVGGEDDRVAAPAAEAIADYIRRERIAAPVVIGHSLGGEVALMLGARQPELVGRLMVVDALPFYSLLMNPAATVAMVTPRAAAYRDAMLTATAEQREAAQAATIARLVKTDGKRRGLVTSLELSDRKTVANATYELMTTDLRPELPRIRVPVAVVYAYDPLYGVPAAAIDATFRNAYAGTPDVRFRRIDGSFHFVMLDQPAALAQVVTDFIDRPVAN
ncbi:alpha/beta hydrolase [Sphingomonas prati]|nr:alpha/beta hydrolase [Sphingomonas prati]